MSSLRTHATTPPHAMDRARTRHRRRDRRVAVRRNEPRRDTVADHHDPYSPPYRRCSDATHSSPLPRQLPRRRDESWSRGASATSPRRALERPRYQRGGDGDSRWTVSARAASSSSSSGRPWSPPRHHRNASPESFRRCAPERHADVVSSPTKRIPEELLRIPEYRREYHGRRRYHQQPHAVAGVGAPTAEPSARARPVPGSIPSPTPPPLSNTNIGTINTTTTNTKTNTKAGIGGAQTGTGTDSETTRTHHSHGATNTATASITAATPDLTEASLTSLESNIMTTSVMTTFPNHDTTVSTTLPSHRTPTTVDRVPKEVRASSAVILHDSDDTESLAGEPRPNRNKKTGNTKDPTTREAVHVGARIEVVPSGNGAGGRATVIQQRVSSSDSSCYLRYDNGNREWIRLESRRWRLLADDGNSRRDHHSDRPPSLDAHTFLVKTALVAQKQPQLSGTENDRLSENEEEKPSRVDHCTAPTCRSAKGSTRITPAIGNADPSASRTVDELETTAVRSHVDPACLESNERDVNSKTSTSSRLLEAQRHADLDPFTTHQRQSETTVTEFDLGNLADENWVAAGAIPRDRDDDSDSDEEEIMEWASRMFGVARPQPTLDPSPAAAETDEKVFDWSAWGDVHIPISEKVKLGRRRKYQEVVDSEGASRRRAKKLKRARRKETRRMQMEAQDARIRAEDEDRRRKKEEARPLTTAEIQKILGEDDCCDESSNWVRRSARQPSKAAINSPLMKALVEKLRNNDSDMVVLKMKKYVNDPNAPQVVIDAALDALEENTNCEALYIQNFNEGMRDEQVLRLIKILQRPSCKIWNLNIGETYKVRAKTWRQFAQGLRDTKVTHMYASEHTISTELKDEIRSTIRDNRSKHSMHCDPENLNTIIRCTHCWWNPINTKSLRPYIKKRGYEFMLQNKEAQGLKGTMNGADLK